MSVTLHNGPKQLARLAWAVNAAIYAGGGINAGAFIVPVDPEDLDAAKAAGLNVRDGLVHVYPGGYEAVARLIAEANRATYVARYAEEPEPTPHSLGYDSDPEERLEAAWSILARFRNNIYPGAAGGKLALRLLAELMDELADARMRVDDPFGERTEAERREVEVLDREAGL